MPQVTRAQSPQARVLLVGYGELPTELAARLRSTSILVDVYSHAAQVKEVLRSSEYHAMLVDADGLETAGELIAETRRIHPGLVALVVGTSPSSSLLVSLIRAGAYDFLPKPLDIEKVASTLHFLCQRRLVTEVQNEVSHKLRSSSAMLDQEQIELSREVFRVNQALKRVNKTLKQHVSQLTILYQMGRDISETENWSDALDRFLMALVNYIQADGAALLLFSDNEQRLAARSNFQVDPAVLTQSCNVLLEHWRSNPRGTEIHCIESYREGKFGTCLERARSWAHTIIPLRHRNRSLGFFFFEKAYPSHVQFNIDYHFLTTVQTIIAEEVASASYISELRQLSRFNQKVLDTITSGVVTTDLEGRVRFFNQRAASMCPAIRDRAMHFNELFHSTAFVQDFNAQVLASEKTGFVLDVKYSGSNGRHYPARLSISKMHDDNLNGTVLVAIFEDLTDQKLLEHELRRNDRLRVLGQLSAGVAHEIRNPLTGIATSVEVLGGKVHGDEEKTKYIRVILDEIQRLDEIIRNLLSFARPPTPRLEPCVLTDIADRVLGLLSDQARTKGVALTAREKSTDDVCYVDANQLTQVLLNVVLNSIQACRQGDAVEIVVGSEGESESGVGASARIDVIDSGPGVPAEVRDTLFDPFVTTKSHGTGLGLAICQQIVEEHHGTIECEALDRGTRFTILLPLKVRQAPLGRAVT